MNGTFANSQRQYFEHIKGDVAVKQNFQLKMYLILQSFAPLFLLILVRHFRCDFVRAVCRFLEILKSNADGLGEKLRVVAATVMSYQFLGDFAVSMLCVLWLVGAVGVWIGFKDYQTVNFESYGERIKVTEDASEGGASYFVAFILPLLVDDVSTLRGFAVFVFLLTMLILLIARSNLFYQNPVLAMLKYKVFRFTFLNPYSDITMADKTYTGITKGTAVESDAIIKRKYIAGDVFLIYDDQRR